MAKISQLGYHMIAKLLNFVSD